MDRSPSGSHSARPDEGGWRLGIVVLAHREPGQLGDLLRALRHPRVSLYLHLDVTTPREPFEAELRRGEGVPLTWLRRHRSRWGGPEVVDASLEGLAAALGDGCSYVIQISGQDFPLQPIGDIVSFFRENAERSFVMHFPLPDDRWRFGGRLRTECYTYTVLGRRETHLPPRFRGGLSWKGGVLNALLGIPSFLRGPRRFPDYVRPHGGSQWWNLSAAAGRFVLDFVARHPDYRAWHEHTLLPDEVFFQSIVSGTDFADGHEVVDDALRFMEWEEGASHPRVLTLDDLPELLAAEEPFARKFDVAVDGEVLRELVKVIHG